jgi:hypothetical protein
MIAQTVEHTREHNSRALRISPDKPITSRKNYRNQYGRQRPWNVSSGKKHSVFG